MKRKRLTIRVPSQSVTETVPTSLLNAMTVHCNDMTVQNVCPCSKKRSQFKLMFSGQILRSFSGSFSREVRLYVYKMQENVSWHRSTSCLERMQRCKSVCKRKTVINSSVACHTFKIERKDCLIPEINGMQLPRVQCPSHNEKQGSRQ